MTEAQQISVYFGGEGGGWVIVKFTEGLTHSSHNQSFALQLLSQADTIEILYSVYSKLTS